MYSAREDRHIKNGPDTWNSLLIGIYDEEKRIGEYVRNYSSFAESTFFPFKKDGKWYALYSKDYTSTRVMSLPDCKDLGGEPSSPFGFCPVEFYVPQVKDEPHKFTLKDKEGKEQECTDFESADEEVDINIENPDLVSKIGTFGFVAGCIWGDDSSWKIAWLDLSKIEEGIILKSAKFGYIELPQNQNLKEAVSRIWIMKDAIQITLNMQITWRQREDKLICYGKNYLAGDDK